MKVFMVLVVIIIVGVSSENTNIKNSLKEHERVIKQVDLGNFFSFFFNVIRASDAMRELLTPIFLPVKFEVLQGPDAIGIEGIEVHGLDRLFVQGTPKVVYTDKKNVIFDASVVAKYIEVGLYYKFGRLPPDSVIGHVNEVMLDVTMEVPMYGGGHPRCTRFNIAEFKGYTLTSGNPLVLPIAGSELLADTLVAIISSEGEGLINQFLVKVNLPDVPDNKTASKQEL